LLQTVDRGKPTIVYKNVRRTFGEADVIDTRAQRLRDRAQEFRASADQAIDPNRKNRLLVAAEIYDRSAESIEKGALASTG
jgi:Holliday junction resolvase-like predicted endonuclease